MDTSDASLSSNRPAPTLALRLTFAYRGNDIRLIDSRRVEAIAPPAVTPLPQPGHTGYWFQVTDSAGRVIYHRVLHSPVAVDVEAFSPDGRQTITRVPIADPQGQFSVLMPDDSGGREFRVARARGCAQARAAGTGTGAPRCERPAQVPPEGRRTIRVRHAEGELTMGAADGFISGTTKIVDHGPESPALQHRHPRRRLSRRGNEQIPDRCAGVRRYAACDRAVR